MKCIDRNSKEMCLLSLGALTHFISLGGDRQGWTRAGNEIISRREICKTLHCTVYSTVTTCVLLVTHTGVTPAVTSQLSHTVNNRTLLGMDEARLQVDQVTNIMRGNVDKIMERDGKLQDLETKAEQLQADSQQFQVRSEESGVGWRFSMNICRKLSSRSRGRPGWRTWRWNWQ